MVRADARIGEANAAFRRAPEQHRLRAEPKAEPECSARTHLQAWTGQALLRDLGQAHARQRRRPKQKFELTDSDAVAVAQCVRAEQALSVHPSAAAAAEIAQIQASRVTNELSMERAQTRIGERNLALRGLAEVGHR